MRVGPFDIRIPAIVGRLLGNLHQTAPAAVRAFASGTFHKELPWVLQPIGNHHHGGRRARFLSVFLADRTIARVVEDLRRGWRGDSLTHGDSRLENFVICRPENVDTPLDTRLVDWELADIGDATWDCASVMQHYWSHWMSAASSPPSQWDALASALIAFSDAYTTSRSIVGQDRGEFLRRATLFTGMRLVQNSYEHFAIARAWTPHASRSLHLARLLLTEPGQAWKGFVGLGHAI
jgi:aminoglycoside phosphotransferase (APT) family kinase protein